MRLSWFLPSSQLFPHATFILNLKRSVPVDSVIAILLLSSWLSVLLVNLDTVVWLASCIGK